MTVSHHIVCVSAVCINYTILAKLQNISSHSCYFFPLEDFPKLGCFTIDLVSIVNHLLIYSLDISGSRTSETFH